MSNKLILTNGSSTYNSNRIYKVNEITTYLGYDYQNVTGRNTTPGIDVNWVLTKVKKNYVHDFISEVGQQEFTIPAEYSLGTVFLNRTFLTLSEYTFSAGILTIIETLETGTVISTR